MRVVPMLTVSVSAHIGPHLRLISSEASVHGLGANIPDRVTRQCHRTQHYDTQRPCTERLSVCRANRAILASTELELQPVASPDRPPKGGRFGDRVEDDARYNRCASYFSLSHPAPSSSATAPM